MTASTAATETDFLRHVLTDAPTYGWAVSGADNGEETIETTDIEAAIEWSRQCDEGRIILRDLLDRKGGNWAWLSVIWQGQGGRPSEVLHDYSYKLRLLIEAAHDRFPD